MSGLVESATAVMQTAERRLDIISRNVANVSTPGYKRRIGFSTLVASGRSLAPEVAVRTDTSQGKLQATGNPLDLAISGDGYFRLRDGESTLYSRQGQFSLAADGSVVTAQGFVLQQAGGGDLLLDRATVAVKADGTIFDGDAPVGRVAVYRPDDLAEVDALDGAVVRFPDSAAEEVGEPMIRQGMLEASNVSVGDEMTTMMTALRQAESGAKLVQTYDDLLGRAITAFGQSGR